MYAETGRLDTNTRALSDVNANKGFGVRECLAPHATQQFYRQNDFTTNFISKARCVKGCAQEEKKRENSFINGEREKLLELFA